MHKEKSRLEILKNMTNDLANTNYSELNNEEINSVVNLTTELPFYLDELNRTIANLERHMRHPDIDASKYTAQFYELKDEREVIEKLMKEIERLAIEHNKTLEVAHESNL